MPDSNRQYYSSQPVENNIKPGSSEALVEMHLAIYSNTRHIMQGEPYVNVAEQVERLERISEMLFWNTDEIRNVNEALSERTSYYFIFGNPKEGRDRLRILHHQRERIKRIWNWQLEKMKL